MLASWWRSVPTLGHLVSHDEMMLRVNCNLHVIANDPGVLATCRHRACVRIGQRDLLVLTLHPLRIVALSRTISSLSFSILPCARIHNVAFLVHGQDHRYRLRMDWRDNRVGAVVKKP